jgi:hypothetical protein
MRSTHVRVPVVDICVELKCLSVAVLTCVALRLYALDIHAFSARDYVHAML